MKNLPPPEPLQPHPMDGNTTNPPTVGPTACTNDNNDNENNEKKDKTQKKNEEILHLAPAPSPEQTAPSPERRESQEEINKNNNDDDGSDRPSPRHQNHHQGEGEETQEPVVVHGDNEEEERDDDDEVVVIFSKAPTTTTYTTTIPQPEQPRKLIPSTNLYDAAAAAKGAWEEISLPDDCDDVPNEETMVELPPLYYRQWLDDRCRGLLPTRNTNNEEHAVVDNDDDTYEAAGWIFHACRRLWLQGVVAQAPRWFEQNACLQLLGRVGWDGCAHYKSRRRGLMETSLLLNLVTLMLLVVAFLGAVATPDATEADVRTAVFNNDRNQGIVTRTAWTQGQLTAQIDLALDKVGFETSRRKILVQAGLRVVVALLLEEDDHTAQDDIADRLVVLPLADVCAADPAAQAEMATSANLVLFNDHDCNGCVDLANFVTTALIVTFILTVLSMTTNVLRMQPNYDINCQKFTGIVLGTLSVLVSGYAWFSYTNVCLNSFPEGSDVVAFPHDDPHVLSRLAPDDNEAATLPLLLLLEDGSLVRVLLTRAWRPGPGLICLLVATMLRALECLIHLLVPTPSITRNLDEQRAYEEQQQRHQRGTRSS